MTKKIILLLVAAALPLSAVSIGGAQAEVIIHKRVVRPAVVHRTTVVRHPIRRLIRHL